MSKISRSDEMISITTPQLSNGSFLVEEFGTPLVLVVAGDVIAEVNFIYKPNPVIEDVFPLQGIQA